MKSQTEFCLHRLVSKWETLRICGFPFGLVSTVDTPKMACFLLSPLPNHSRGPVFLRSPHLLPFKTTRHRARTQNSKSATVPWGFLNAWKIGRLTPNWFCPPFRSHKSPAVKLQETEPPKAHHHLRFSGTKLPVLATLERCRARFGEKTARSGSNPELERGCGLL